MVIATEGVAVPGSRLSLVDRARMAALFEAGVSFAGIGRAIGRPTSTVSREFHRNHVYRGAHTGSPVVRHPLRRRAHGPGWGGAYRWAYSFEVAQRKAQARARRPKPRRLFHGFGQPTALGVVVLERLALRWSPVQIAGWLRTEFPGRPEMQVSHETIYQAIYYQARGELRRHIAHQVALRQGRSARRAQSRAAATTRERGKPWAALRISQRPAEAADRAVPGHWEGDLIIGARASSAIITLVERSTRFVLLGALPHSRVSEQVVQVLIQLMGALPAHLRKTLAWDQGAEMAGHAAFSLATDCQVYFCDPHSPWQRGSNENTNGLLRQYFPRASTDFRTYTQTDLDAVADELNARPRQTLNFQTPAQQLNALLVATTT
jgi:IS30 family transposase